jgi:hypothetical protein
MATPQLNRYQLRRAPYHPVFAVGIDSRRTPVLCASCRQSGSYGSYESYEVTILLILTFGWPVTR